ncbi:microtubule organizer protein 1-like [Amaranthus tricolor]|uniref:microtubule organizer protein 1-like n=1 Tax=Amaranthus tricolor TaxID=29722 RepID=UPI00258958D7|nr:microtubule organizer protein 1-like [Amaranthus tricolor]
MDDTGAILLQISTLKDMLDKVNDEIEANIQITREIESEIVKIEEIETSLAARESELLKLVYLSQYELSGLVAVTVNSRKSVAALAKETNQQRRERDDMLEKLNKKREVFSKACIEFQKSIEGENCNELRTLLSNKESLEDDIHKLDQKDAYFPCSVSALHKEILEDLLSSNSDLASQIQERQAENEQIVEEIEELKSVLLSAVYDVDDPW